MRNVVSNAVLENAIDKVRDSVREGAEIADELKKSGVFPPLVVHMIAVGERSGELENMLSKISAVYEQRLAVNITVMTNLLQPIMIVLMAGSVGFIIFAILTPIMQMSQMVK